MQLLLQPQQVNAKEALWKPRLREEATAGKLGPEEGCLSPGWEGSLSLQETSTDSDLRLKMVLYHITVSVIKFYRVHAWNNVKESHLPD